MATRDVSANGDGNKKGKGVGDGGGDETGGSGGAAFGKLTEGYAGTLASKNKDQGGNELSQPSLQSIWMSSLFGPSNCNVTDRHGYS